MDTGKLIESMKRVVKSELGSYDTTATVRRIEGDTAWVHIPGGVDETPVRLTMNAKEGDNVQVRVSDGKAFLAGNVSAPPTDDTTAEAAKALANRAAEDAGRAKSAADIAESYATSAQASAAQSANILEGMEQAAIAAGTTLDGIYADAAEAKATTDEINTYATSVSKTVTQILTDGETAGVAAQAASEAANSALVGLSTVEDVVGVLNWITEHGTMTLTSDVTVNPAHVYFIVDPAGDYDVGGTNYSIVSEPNDDDIGTYYELSVDESVQNYVATHVAVDTEGLWLIPDSGGNKILIATGAGSSYTTAGTYIIGKVNGIDTVFAKFTEKGLDVTTKNGTQVAQLGYDYTQGPGGSPKESPFFTLGSRKSGSTIGYYSIAEGLNNTASVSYSHAEGNNNIASGYGAHAEGASIGYGAVNTASGMGSHAEGAGATASGYGAHAEGKFVVDDDWMTPINTVASGDGSHAQNYGTIAASDYQTALGKLNVADNSDTYAVIVGNGTGNNARSNALTVDWSGNVDIASGAKYKINGAAIGTVKQAYASAKSVASGTNTNLTSISLEAGTWVITGGVRFPNNATGYRRMNISTSNASGWADVQLPALSGASTQLAYTVVVSTTSTKTYYLNCYHNAGAALNLVAGGSENGINFLRAVRIA